MKWLRWLMGSVLVLLGAAVFWVYQMIPEDTEVLIVAHRGASADLLENTLPAFQLAWEMGADAIEGDFRLTADGEIVCIHDETTERVGGVDVAVSESRWDELREIELKAGGDEPVYIPRLQDVLETVPAGKCMVVEVKTGVEIVPRLVEVLDLSGLLSEQVFVISFDSDVLRELKQSRPEWTTALLVDFEFHGLSLKPSFDEVLASAREAQVDGVSTNAHPMLAANFGERVLAQGFEYHVWTVDSTFWASIQASRGAQSITTNEPDSLLKHFGRLTQGGNE